MREYFGLAVAYFLLAALTVLLLYQDVSVVLAGSVDATATYLVGLAHTAPWFAFAVSVLFVAAAGRVLFMRRRDLLLAVSATIVLQVGFSLIKNAIPLLVPYYADPALAEFDRTLHGGTDPWVLAHAIGAYLPMKALLAAYLEVWVVVALALPVFLAAADEDENRVRRFAWLYAGVWLILGNAAALAGSSVGPVFYDRLLGTERFMELTAALAASPVPLTLVGELEAHLWARYLSGEQTVGLGISAFPSVHVAISTLVAIYLAERTIWLGLAGSLFAVLILFLSVYTGLHYAIDGYVSILAVLLGWRVMKSLNPVSAAQQNCAPT